MLKPKGEKLEIIFSFRFLTNGYEYLKHSHSYLIWNGIAICWASQVAWW